MRKDLGDFLYRIYIGMFPTNKSPKISNKFFCEKCNYKCNKQSEINKHNSTRKHQILQNHTSDITLKSHICKCGKVYKHSSTLYAHKKKCDYDENKIIESKQITTIDPIDHASLTEKMIELVMSKNQEFMNVFMEKIVHMLPSINGNHNSITTNNNNNQFNIQMFLNEHCKNAMNLSDFIKSLPLTVQQYENTKDKGLTDTLMNMMVDGLNNLDVIERPIHCTDQKRKVMYVKDNDKWEKDTKGCDIIMKHMKELSYIHKKNVKLWQDKNPNFDTIESLQIAFCEICTNIFANLTDDMKNVSKLMKGLSDATYLDDDTKSEYSTYDTLASV